MCVCIFFFFKQKTAYEMRISDWSSDVCSSDLLGKRAIDRRLKAFDRPGRMIRRGRLAISAPPPKLKKDRKKLDAAKAIDRPKTIWISLRKPPAVSPKASVSPVVMLMITATILARSEERRVGKECGSTFRYRWGPS